MDEVFDLRERNQWLRRQIVAVLRQILKAMFGKDLLHQCEARLHCTSTVHYSKVSLVGDIVNRRIVDYFAHLTSPTMLASLAGACKDSLWPDGYPAETRPPRDEATKMRTRVAAKMTLFSVLPYDLYRVVGSETTRAGLLVLFDMLQHPVLNKRLAIVLFEGVLETLFPDRQLADIFVRLHSRSSRVRNELKNSHRKHVDLRKVTVSKDVARNPPLLPGIPARVPPISKEQPLPV